MFTTTPYDMHHRLPHLPENTDWPRLVDGYRHMALIRTFDKKAVNLQRTGKLGTYASCLGAEAIAVAGGMALHDSDVFVPYYRDHATQYLRGVPLYQILQYWGGDERGNAFPADTPAARDLPNCVPIATQLTQAAGIANSHEECNIIQRDSSFHL